MKKLSFGFLAALAINSALYSQTLQASLGPGSAANRVKIFVKSSAAVPTSNISTLQFNLGISDAIDPRPTITVFPNTTNFPSVVWQIQNVVEGGFYHYSLTTPTSPIIVNSLNTTNEVEVCEIEFLNGPVGPNDVRLITLPGGGAADPKNRLFLATGTPSSDDAVGLYFTRPGVVVVNNPSYEGTLNSTATVSNIALPVKFLSFIALKSGDDAKLSWTVENDVDNRYFELERSKDGREFKAFAKIDALGNGKAVNTYSLTDVRISNVGSKVVYYRVKQVDKDGTITYSNIRNLGIERNGIAVSIYPNPARSITKLVFDAEKAGRGNVLIRDMNGKLVQQVTSQFIAGVNQQELNVSNLAAGEYNVTITGTGFDHTLKLTKVN
jgi:hypothetical protein